ncbi:cellulose synthase complex periplasmic endoglucanase BcsZ [Photobacterium sp. 1_MG-2023]|uniref:cellulose synthase complex periplasmic endoglucanase BcsZ n=1 Tax=Photobacterium sp. 1_MG-2023 TaxID=3062646 RepID=UPI0026E327C1|nr:cellulose synthase complex periplasmic endoglucanase BcsZ [Photobacterium sp. 1_MG-2023]MDO6708362.1 cellulose synthase complex periplasmic endoglucanase BcsZ [Photobacterium sp. 1_MG-2023]
MKALIFLLALLISLPGRAATCDWPQWQQFQSIYIVNGRVVDGSDARQITTSEGQSYALFFALVANDRAMFAELLNWTQTHLASGDLTARLPAWQWGRQASGRFGVLDANPASDSDLWIAYTLAEAGRLWDNFYYQSLAHLLASRIMREETVLIDGLGTVLLPGISGFELGDGQYSVNPSYVPLQIMARFRALYPHDDWASLYQTSQALMLATMPAGFSPDWAKASRAGFHLDPQTGFTGSYNAIRSYLWAGMLSDASPEKAALVAAMQPMVAATARLSAPPREVNTSNGKFQQSGSAGFSAAMLPLIHASGEQALLKTQAERAAAMLVSQPDDYYYDNVLALFGLGWHQARYRFDVDGKLLPAWENQCQ